jgi:broad specificity phosphatase PhoE
MIIHPMRKIYWLSLIILLAYTGASAQDNSITTFILVRHAEKGNDGSDPELKPEGLDRAMKLATMLKNTPVDAVYSSNYKRTRNTVFPLAKEKGIEIQTYDAGKSEVIDTILSKYAGGTVVICGHSNTVPQLANVLTGKQDFKNFEDSDYGNLLIISVVKKGSVAKVTWLSY